MTHLAIRYHQAAGWIAGTVLTFVILFKIKPNYVYQVLGGRLIEVKTIELLIVGSAKL